MKKIFAIILIFSLFCLSAQTRSIQIVNASINDFTNSIYIYQSYNMYNEGYYYYDSNPNTSYSIIILDFGAPQYGNRVYGIGKYGSGPGQFTPFTGTNSIVNDVNQFIAGYNANPSHSGKYRGIAIGFNTSVDVITQYGGNFTDFGRALKSALTQVTLTGYINHIYATIDAEQGSDFKLTPSQVRSIIDGFSAGSSPYYFMIDFGDDELGTNPGSATQNGWTADDVWYVAYGAVLDFPIPEIYFKDMAQEWSALSLWAYNNKGGAIVFDGVSSENGVNGTLYDSESYTALLQALQNNPITYQSDLYNNSNMIPKGYDFYIHRYPY